MQVLYSGNIGLNEGMYGVCPVKPNVLISPSPSPFSAGSNARCCRRVFLIPLKKHTRKSSITWSATTTQNEGIPPWDIFVRTSSSKGTLIT